MVAVYTWVSLFVPIILSGNMLYLFPDNCVQEPRFYNLHLACIFLYVHVSQVYWNLYSTNGLQSFNFCLLIVQTEINRIISSTIQGYRGGLTCNLDDKQSCFNRKPGKHGKYLISREVVIEDPFTYLSGLFSIYNSFLNLESHEMIPFTTTRMSVKYICCCFIIRYFAIQFVYNNVQRMK